jgi:hypothetical protein
MKHTLIVTVTIAVSLTAGVLFATEKVDISKVITKSDAEAVLGGPVKDAKGKNKEGADGFYDSDWSYYAVSGDKAIIFDFVVAGTKAPPHLTQTMFSVMGPEHGKPASVEGFGDKAIFYHDKSGLEMMNILKGEALITIGIHGLPPEQALEQEKSLAKKILEKM